MLPGYRCTAGGVAHSAANASGSWAAIVAGSRWSAPRRSAIFCGPAKARSIGNCWSSSMPASSANGSRSSSASAAGSPVRARGIAVLVLFLGLDRENGAGRVEQDALRVAAEDQLAHRGPAAQADHDDVGVPLLGDRDDVLGGVEPAHQLADLVLHAVLVELLPDRLELALVADRVVVVGGSALAAGAFADHAGGPPSLPPPHPPPRRAGTLTPSGDR